MSVSFKYDKLTLTRNISGIVSTAKPTKEAWYTMFDGDMLKLGDGETATLDFGVSEKNAGDVTYTYSFKPAEGSGVTGTKVSNGTYMLQSDKDYTESGYLIEEGYAPAYNGSTTYSTGKPIKVTDFKLAGGQHSFDWIGGRISGWEGCKGQNAGTSHYKRSAKIMLYNTVNNTEVWSKRTEMKHLAYAEFTLASVSRSGSWTVVRDTSLDGTFVPKKEFESIAWYYVSKYSYNTGDYCPSSIYHSVDEVDKTHVKATYYEQMPDATVQSSNFVGTLTVTASAGETVTKYEIPVFLETRICACTYKK